MLSSHFLVFWHLFLVILHCLFHFMSTFVPFDHFVSVFRHFCVFWIILCLFFIALCVFVFVFFLFFSSHFQLSVINLWQFLEIIFVCFWLSYGSSWSFCPPFEDIFYVLNEVCGFRTRDINTHFKQRLWPRVPWPLWPLCLSPVGLFSIWATVLNPICVRVMFLYNLV